MSLLSDRRPKRAPWHLWVVGVLALLWNAVGALDFVMTQTRNEQYMAQFTAEQLAYFYGFPLWLVIFWGIAVWGGVLGALFLLFRKRLAVWCFFISLIAMLVTTVHNLVLSNGIEVMGDSFTPWFTAAIVVISIALFFYAGIMNRNRILR